MSEQTTTSKTFTVYDDVVFPITVKLPFGEVTLADRVEFAHDVFGATGFYVEGDPEGERAMVFLGDDQEFEVVKKTKEQSR